MRKGLQKFFFLFGLGLFSQPMMAESCDMLVSACNFEFKADSIVNGSIEDVVTKGYASSMIIVDRNTFSPLSNTNEDFSFYGITSNPHDVDPKYIDLDKNMYVVHIPSNDVDYSMKRLFTYKVSGLKPGSDYEVSFNIHMVNAKAEDLNVSYFIPIEISAGILYDPIYSKMQISESVSLEPGKSQKVTLKGSLTDNLDYLTLDVFSGYSYVGGTTIGISDIEVKGCYVAPRPLSDNGLEVCVGDPTILSLDHDYGASTFEWMMKSPGGEFKSVGNEKNLHITLDETGDYLFYCNTDEVISDTITISSIVCCEINGIPLPRMDIIYEDFGYFIDEHTYVDSKGNVTITPDSYAPERADVSWNLAELSNMVFDSVGSFNDGFYGVVVPRESGIKAGDNTSLSWFNGVSSDHSIFSTGKKNGAALFVNVAYNYKGAIYSKSIDDQEFCKGKELRGEVYIANFSGVDDPVVALQLKDGATGEVLCRTEGTAKANSGWIKLSFQHVLEHNVYPLIFEVLTIGDSWVRGNDLIIDDIRLLTCVTPNVALFADESFDNDDIIIRKDTNIVLTTSDTKTLEKYYDNNHQFLFQQSTDNKNWTNVSEPTSENICTIKSTDLIADTSYFRVVVVPQSEMDFIYENPNSVSYDEVCRIYSISQKSVKIISLIPECDIPAPKLITQENQHFNEGYLEIMGPTLRQNVYYGDSLKNVDHDIYLTSFDEYIIKSDEKYGLLWSQTGEDPWTDETPVVDVSKSEHQYMSYLEEIGFNGYLFYVKQTNGKCESAPIKLIVIEVEITDSENIADNKALSYYVDGDKLVVNAEDGSVTSLYTQLGQKIAEKKVFGNRVEFATKDQSIVILVVDGIANKVVMKK
ncbi:MAG: hypothetical protein E7077_11050 [Bacteroidales bacterium]|jgi:hypothetical protein|nr:hypothetical protein [Bacteroidales bacterium]